MTNTPEIGKIPPQAVDLEQAVLGAILIEKDRLIDVIDKLDEAVFYKPEHQTIFRAIQTIYRRSAVDILTVTNQLRTSGELEGVGGAVYISSLTDRVASSLNTPNHVAILREKKMQRDLIALGSELEKRGYTEDAFESLEFAEKTVMNLRPQPAKSPDIVSVSKRAITAITTAAATGSIGMPTGFDAIDKLTGLVKSDLIVLAARPGMGKTALALNIARKVSEIRPVAVFSLEMSAEQLYSRMLSAEIEVSLQRVLRGDLNNYEFDNLYEADTLLKSLPLYIDDTPALSIFDLCSRARRFKLRHDVGFIVVDYLQLMHGDRSGNREREISSISQGLKSLAKELDIPIMALSQLSREVEKRGEKIPQLSDLRESGAIEQDADEVVFLYREWCYNQEADMEECQVYIAKNRNGKTGRCDNIRFLGQFTKFKNYGETIDTSPDRSF